MNSRKISAVAVAALASAALCGSGLLAGTAPVADAASSVVTLTYPSGALETLDTVDWDANILVDNGTLLEGLYGYNTKNQIVPKIATKAVPSNGGLTWTIYMRHNARWSNGAPVTAQDFKFAWMRLVAPSDTVGATWAGVTNNIANAWNYHIGAVPEKDVGIDVVNNYELKITLTGRTNIKGLLALAASMPLYPPVVKAHPTDWFEPQYFVGDGPYVVHSYVPNGELVMTRNRHYVGVPNSVGNVQQIDLQPAPTVPLEDYEAGKLDAAILTSPSDYKYAKEHYQAQLHAIPDASINDIEYDHSVDPSPLDNQLVREAVAMAINRNPIAQDVLNGMVGVTSVFSYPGFVTDTLEHNPYSYNVAKARRLLAKAGYPNGKGIGQLYLYTQTATAAPNDIPIAEAVAEELKLNLGLNFKIEPIPSTEIGYMNVGGIAPTTEPGYAVGYGTANWNQPQQWPLQSDQWMTLNDSGDIPDPGTNFQKYAENFSFSTYDPMEVKAWGNPTDTSLGIKYSQWQPIIKAATTAIQYINAWTKRQPAAYQSSVDVPGSISLTTQLLDYEHSYSQAKTNTEKHAAWADFWEWAGSYASPSSDNASVGVVDQAYVDAHEPLLEKQMRILEAELDNTGSTAQSAQFSAEMGNLMIKAGLIIPLNYNKTIFLEKPDLTGAQANPWDWNGFYQFQYMNLK